MELHGGLEPVRVHPSDEQRKPLPRHGVGPHEVRGRVEAKDLSGFTDSLGCQVVSLARRQMHCAVANFPNDAIGQEAGQDAVDGGVRLAQEGHKFINSADVVQAAIHLTAVTLAGMSPQVRFEQMELHSLRLGRDVSKKIRLVSLDWLEAPETQSFFLATEEQIGAASGEGSVVQRPMADLVSNPPFTRRGRDGGKEEAISRVFSLPEGDLESQRVVAKPNAHRPS